MIDILAVSPAEKEGIRALSEIEKCITNKQCFKLEAGAGAGKTYSLIKTLELLIEQEGRRMPRLNQKIACITFTNVAQKEIEARIDKNPLIHCDTIHGFCWSIISRYQSQLRTILPEMGAWSDRLEEAGGVGSRRVEYTLGYRRISDEAISLHHDDILPLKIELLKFEKFRNIFRQLYPIILIDEYQDTNNDWIEAIKEQYLDKEDPPLFGFFGDHWQKIYGNGCGELIHPAIKEIGKGANFRSVSTIVDCLNRMRPELEQFVEDPEKLGEIHVFHTNNWNGARLTGAHYGGDLPDDEASLALSTVKNILLEQEWNFSAGTTKILMLTHRALGKQQGYSSLPSLFRYNDSFTKKENPHIAFFVDHLEPACQAFNDKKFGAMFLSLGIKGKYISKLSDKKSWSQSMTRLNELRESGTVLEVIAHLMKTGIPRLPDSVKKVEAKLSSFDFESGEDLPRALEELRSLHDVKYQEIVSLANYLDGHSPFETKHGVKGAQFENVLVILGRGWNQYNFNEMLEWAGAGNVPAGKVKKYENNRNLFYVACSRPKKRLAFLFTQELSFQGLNTVNQWFGSENVIPIL